MVDKKKLLILPLALAAAVPLVAQTPAPPPPDRLPTSIEGPGPAVRYLMETYGIAEAEALDRLQLQQEVTALATALRRGSDPAFGGIWIEHAPVFKIVVAFADQKDRQALRESIAPNLRRHVQIVHRPRSDRDISAQLDQLTAAISAANIPYASGYTVQAGRFFVAVESQQHAQQVRALIPPALRGDVEVRVEPIPKPQQTVTGVQPGDYLYAGFMHYQNNNPVTPGCTWAYAVRYGSSNLPGILTASHCPGAFYYNGHWINLGTPVVDKNDPNTKYDYKVHATTGLTQGPWVYFEDKNSIPEFPASGYFKVTGTLGYYGQTVGMVMCKSGRVTGITCGEITHGWYTYNGAKGWIEVGNTQQADLSDGGDSGGPWFVYPGTATNITAVGIHTAGTASCTGPTCKAVYMPIDYVDDHIPVSLVLGAP